MTERLYHPGPDGHVSNDPLTRAAWGPIPTADTFWTGGHYEVPTEVHGWAFSTTFGHWRALVTFEDGWHGFTDPKITKSIGLEDDERHYDRNHGWVLE